jgi:hypothetical protein
MQYRETKIVSSMFCVGGRALGSMINEADYTAEKWMPLHLYLREDHGFTVCQWTLDGTALEEGTELTVSYFAVLFYLELFCILIVYFTEYSELFILFLFVSFRFVSIFE